MKTVDMIIDEVSKIKHKLAKAGIDMENIVLLLPRDDIAVLREHMAKCATGAFTEQLITNQYKTVMGLKVMSKDR